MNNASNSSPAVSPYRWVILALLFFATTINYIDRQILALLKPMLDNELHWTNKQYGEVNAVFQGAYAFGLLGFGWFIDRFGTKIGYAVSIFAWSAAAAGHAFVGSISGFRWARISLGVGEGGNFPAAVKTVAQWFPRAERAFANALFNSGTNIGALIAPAVIPILAVTYGWRSTFVAAGVLGVIWLLFWIPLYKKAPQLAEEEVAEEVKIPWFRLLGTRQAWAYMTAKFLTDPVWWFYLIWLPDYFKKEQHLDIKASAPLLVTLYGIVTVLSILSGWGVKKFAEKGFNIIKVRKLSLLLFALCSLPIFFVRGLGMWEAVILIGFAGAAHQAWSASLYATISDTFPKQAIASVSGLGGMVGSIGGIIFPIVAGSLLDSDPVNGYGKLFTLCGFAYIVAFTLHHILLPKLDMADLGEDEDSGVYSICAIALSLVGLISVFVSFNLDVYGKLPMSGLVITIAAIVFSKMGEKSHRAELAKSATYIAYIAMAYSALIYAGDVWAYLNG